MRVRVGVLLAVMLAAWGWFDVRVRGKVDPADLGLHKTDFTVYTEAGAAFFDGRDPYTVTNPRGWGYLYPPLFAMLVAPLQAIPPEMQVLVWFALSVLMAWGSIAECVRIARAVMPAEPDVGTFGPIPNWIGMTSLAAAAFPALNCLQRGQVGIAKVYLLLLGLRLCISARSPARWFLGGAVLALPIVLKVTPLLPVAFLVCVQFACAWRTARLDVLRRATACSAGLSCGLIVCVLLVPAGLVGWRTNLGHLGTWWRTVAVEAEHSTGDDFAGDSYSRRNQSLSNAVRRLGNWASYCFAGGVHDEGTPELGPAGKGLAMDSRVVDAMLAAARAGALCLLMALGWRVAGSDDRLAVAAGFALAGVSTLIVAPIARGHYFVLLLPATMLLGTWLVREKQPRLAAWCTIAPAALTVAHYAWIEGVGRVGLLGIGLTIWYAASCIVLARLAVPSTARRAQPISVCREAMPLERPLAA